MDKIYLDYNSTTPLDPNVSKAMEPYLLQYFGNAASQTHSFGHKAKEAVHHSRKVIANSIHSRTDEIIFTSGATESINMAIKGVISASNRQKKHILTLATEHKAVLDTCKYLEELGVENTLLPVDNEGFVSTEELNDCITQDTLIVVVLHGNNEIGTIQPIEEIGKICKARDIPFFVDAAQTFGKISINVKDSSITMLAGSAHKLYGPKGIGFLYLDNEFRSRIHPLIHGGGHEMGMRSGTLNVAGIVGLGSALELISKLRDSENERIRYLIDTFINHLSLSGLEFSINGPTVNRLPGNINIGIKGVDADWLTTMLPTIAIARGSACTSETIQPSHVLRAIGLSDQDADSSIRVSVGRFTTEEEVTISANKIVEKANTYISKRATLAI